MIFLECGKIYLDARNFLSFSSLSGGITIGIMIGSGLLATVIIASAVVGVGIGVLTGILADNIMLR